jgi:hypothetical protein
MDYPSPGTIIDILRNTLQRLEQEDDFHQDDPAVVELKRHIVQSIAELGVMKNIWNPEAGRAVTGSMDRPVRELISKGADSR